MDHQGPTDVLKKIIDTVHLRPKDRWALVIEGGAMRSIFTAGVLDAMQETLLPRINDIISVSAGTGCALSFLCEQKGRSANIFLNYLSQRQFIDYRRLLTADNVMDLRYAIEDIHTIHVPWNIDKYKHKKAAFHVSMLNAQTGETRYVEPNSKNIIPAMIAACNVPYLTREPAVFEDGLYVDGGVSEPIPIQKALALKANKIIVISTRPKGFRKSHSRFMHSVLGRIYSKFEPIANFLEREAEIYNDAKIFLENFKQDDVELFNICPPEEFNVDRLTTDRQSLTQGYGLGVIEGLKMIEHLQHDHSFNKQP